MARRIPLDLFALAALMALAGCAEQWQKPGATPAQFAADQSECQARGKWRYPVSLQPEIVASGTYTPGYESCSTNTTGQRYCTYVPGQYTPPIWSEFDLNGAARAQEVHQCLLQHGWQPVKS